MRRTITAILLLLLPALAPRAQARERPMRLGLQGSWGSDDAGFGAGARLQVGLADFYEGLRGVASFDYFFPESPLDYWEANGNLTYTLRGELAPYVGTGLNLAFTDSPVFDDVAVGVNLLGGLRLSDRVYAEARLALGGGDRFVATVGVLF